MNCPKCNAEMSTVEFGTDITIRRCNGCAGILTDRETLQRMRDEWLADSVLDIGAHTPGLKSTRNSGEISCPCCGSKMKLVRDEEQQHIILDICPTCDAVFLDAGELTDIKTLTLIDHIRSLLRRFT